MPPRKPQQPTTDSQVIGWATGAADALFVSAGTMHAIHGHFTAAMRAVREQTGGRSGHLIESLELSPTLGPDGAIDRARLTVTLPPGAPPAADALRLSSRLLAPADLADMDGGPAEELYALLIGNVLAVARELIGKHDDLYQPRQLRPARGGRTPKGTTKS